MGRDGQMFSSEDTAFGQKLGAQDLISALEQDCSTFVKGQFLLCNQAYKHVREFHR